MVPLLRFIIFYDNILLVPFLFFAHFFVRSKPIQALGALSSEGKEDRSESRHLAASGERLSTTISASLQFAKLFSLTPPENVGHAGIHSDFRTSFQFFSNKDISIIERLFESIPSFIFSALFFPRFVF